jgi:acyl carrier protein
LNNDRSLKKVKEFCVKIAESMDVDAVTESDVLADFPEWDSLSVLSVIAMIDAKYGINLTAIHLKDVRTVADIWNLVQAKKKA